MMKREKIQILICILALSAFCCACGEKGGTIIIGSEQEGRLQEAVTEQRESGAGEPQETKEAGETGEQKGFVRVYVCGAVANPGVVEIPAGSRAEDALRAAGGFGPEAARTAVNLADWVSDGQMLYFPTEEEAVESKSGEETEADGIVNINTADAAQLCTLPGIGESRAADIIAYREANGEFQSCEEIMKVPGIKTGAYEKIKDKIKVK
ncbi:MAG: ComEA family DNA-binding protein [Lachnospiraceae bacterium]|jgi:competence protein ComEA|nr:ComEA family DNA-binding protein [Lachnospiraceae bacterium]